MRAKGSSDAEPGFDRRALEYQIGPGQGNRDGDQDGSSGVEARGEPPAGSSNGAPGVTRR
jgi:hypothetical protein